MLRGIPPVLTGEILRHLDEMGHSDTVVLADAHFPASRLGKRVVHAPLVSTPELLRAIRQVIPLEDAAPGLALMESADGRVLPVQHELIEAVGLPQGAADSEPGEWVEMLDRFKFYDVAADAYLIIRTGETRQYGNALLPKGIVRD